jgi:hypothetical protein
MGENSMSLALNFLQSQPVTNQTYNRNESQLVPTVAFERMPWLLPALQQLDALKSGGRNIPGLGDLRISEQTGAVVRRLLTYVTNRYLPEPQLAPISGGGIAVRWNLPDREVSFRVFPGVQEVVYMVVDERDEIIEDGEFVLDRNNSMSAAMTYLVGR